MIEITRLINIIEEISPPELQEKWDNSGIQIQISESSEISNVLICLEITSETLSEAIEKKADFIITHHPLLFTGLKSISDRSEIGRFVMKLIKENISVYSAHTSFDSVLGGNNDYIARQFGLTDVVPIEPIGDEGHGMGRFGRLIEPISFAELKKRATLLYGKDDILRFVGDDDKMISKIGICSGAGAEYVSEAAERGCEAFITGDVKYHEARYAKESGICLIDGGHYGTEISFADNFYNILSKKITKGIFIFKSNVDNNPFR